MNPPVILAGFLLAKYRENQGHRENIEGAGGDACPGWTGFVGLGKGQHARLHYEGTSVAAISVPGKCC
jgi:hypothetical protein